MKRLSVGALAVGMGVSLVAAAEDESVPREQGVGPVVGKLFDAKEAPLSWQESDPLMRALDGEYASVEQAVIRVLQTTNVKADGGLRYGSREHCAMQTAGRWGLRKASGRLFELICTRLDPASLPRGINISKSAFYPAAVALAQLNGLNALNLDRVNKENTPFVAWVLVESLGKSAAVGVLRTSAGEVANRVESATAMIELIEKAEHTEDLLPVPQLR